MLTELVVENLGVIDHAEITLGPGSIALTGETGAGKTLVVAALELLSGGRADRAKVRTGTSSARVDGRFVIPEGHAVLGALEEAGVLDAGDLEIVVSRTVAADGGSKARINGRPVTAALLAEVTGTLVEIAGQHEHLRLTAPPVQRALLDQFAGEGAAGLAGRVAEAVRELGSARRRLESLSDGARQRERDIDVLRFEIAEISKAAVRAGETDELSTLAARLEHAESLAGGLIHARELLRGEGAAVESLAAATSEIGPLVAYDPELQELVGRLESAAIDIGDVADEITRRVVAPDPDALDEARARLETLGRLHRKYGAGDQEVLAHLERSRAALVELESDDSSLEVAEERVSEALKQAEDLAARLSDARRDAAPRLAERVVRVLADLALPDARFEVRLDPSELYEGGAETVTFFVSANPGEALRPLTKVASGGELSRICLAVRLTGTGTGVTTMVFDEVDAGVGGEAARSVGRAVAQLASSSQAQVLVVTHLPQVAAFADSQYRVSKATRGGRAEAWVDKVESTARVEELSRMLAGMPGSERAREHAQELLELAGREAT